MIQFHEVSKLFSSASQPDVKAVNNVSFTVNEAETLCIIGTSGSGKTTCMKMINRLLEPTSGHITLGGKNVLELDIIELRRSIGYVIQKGGLLPHLTVADNVGLLCKLEKWETKKRKDRVYELLNLVNLPPEEYASRYPAELSGGQQQRVGVARALGLDPGYILMDEPFGALDPITREGLHDEFLRLKREVGKTIVIVTHDLEEAFKLGDRVALMDQGCLIQVGTESEFYENPATEFARNFLKNHDAHREPKVEQALEDGACSLENLTPLELDAPLRQGAKALLQAGCDEWPVADDAGEIVGKITRESVVKKL